MQMNPLNPLIVQGDGTVLLETQHKTFDQMRDFLAQFAELEASPELLHTYRITPLSLCESPGATTPAPSIALRSSSSALSANPTRPLPLYCPTASARGNAHCR